MVQKSSFHWHGVIMHALKLLVNLYSHYSRLHLVDKWIRNISLSSIFAWFWELVLLWLLHHTVQCCFQLESRWWCNAKILLLLSVFLVTHAKETTCQTPWSCLWFDFDNELTNTGEGCWTPKCCVLWWSTTTTVMFSFAPPKPKDSMLHDVLLLLKPSLVQATSKPISVESQQTQNCLNYFKKWVSNEIYYAKNGSEYSQKETWY